MVDGHQVHAAAAERVQGHGQGRGQRLALAGLHLGDAAVVQDHAADQLHIEMAHPHRALAGLAHEPEALIQQLVERLAVRARSRSSSAPRAVPRPCSADSSSKP